MTWEQVPKAPPLSEELYMIDSSGGQGVIFYSSIGTGKGVHASVNKFTTNLYNEYMLIKDIKRKTCLGAMLYTCNPSTWEAEVGTLKFEASLGYPTNSKPD